MLTLVHTSNTLDEQNKSFQTKQNFSKLFFFSFWPAKYFKNNGAVTEKSWLDKTQ